MNFPGNYDWEGWPKDDPEAARELAFHELLSAAELAYKLVAQNYSPDSPEMTQIRVAIEKARRAL